MHHTPTTTHDRPRSGTQFVLRHGDAEAVIASVGATLREFRVAGRDLVLPFAADEVRPAYRGALLAPWPNRVVDGHYSFAGEEHELALSEPGRSHAIHGLAAWLEFQPTAQDADRVTLEAVVEPQEGYPWRIRIVTEFVLGADGLTQVVRATNLSDAAAPYGVGPHPYLIAGPGAVDEWILEAPVTRALPVTADRLVPQTLGEVPAELDFREPRQIGSLFIDQSFTGLLRDAAGMATVRVTAPGGGGVGMSWDESCPWVQLFTTDNQAAAHRNALAVEPMSCAPDAFNRDNYAHDTGLIELEPGATAAASWRIFAI